MQECIFCKIVKGEIPCAKIYEDEISFAFLDINPVNLGHTLIIPKKHFENIYDLPEDTAAHLMKIAKKISIALKKTGAAGTNITINNDKTAGQVIFHSHIHVIPRFVGDNLPQWPPRKPREGEIEAVAKKITQEL
jgi:histidine triad (HIT) family protein